MADLKVLGICGSLRKASLNAGRPAGVPRAAAAGHDAADHEHRGPPHVQPGRVRRRHARAGEAAARRDHGRGRPACSRARNTTSRCRRPQERDRLGLARAEPGVPGQAGGDVLVHPGAARRRACSTTCADPVAALGLSAARPEVFIGNAPSKFADGKLTDETTRKFLTELLAGFKDWIARMQKK